MSSMYQEQILEHFHNPQNWGDLPDHTVSMVGNNHLCGDVIHLKLKLVEDRVVDVKFIAQGCAISVASASLVSEAIKGLSMHEIQPMTKDHVLHLLGIELSPMRLKCGLLVLDTIKEALKKHAKEV